MARKMSADEKWWQAQDDAAAIKRYFEITGDSKRKDAAVGVIRKELQEADKALKTVNNGAKGGKK